MTSNLPKISTFWDTLSRIKWFLQKCLSALGRFWSSCLWLCVKVAKVENRRISHVCISHVKSSTDTLTIQTFITHLNSVATDDYVCNLLNITTGINQLLYGTVSCFWSVIRIFLLQSTKLTTTFRTIIMQFEVLFLFFFKFLVESLYILPI